MESKGEEEEDESTLELTLEYDDLEPPPAKKLATEEDIAKERYLRSTCGYMHQLVQNDDGVQSGALTNKDQFVELFIHSFPLIYSL